MEGENIILLVVRHKHKNISNLVWLVMVACCGRDPDCVLEYCTEVRESWDVKGDVLEEGGVKGRVLTVEENFNPKVKVLLEEIQFVLPARLPQGIYKPVIENCLVLLLVEDMDEQSCKREQFFTVVGCTGSPKRKS